LLDPNLKVVDAVVRNYPVEPSTLITTPTLAGGCSSKSFDLDLMNINYETLGMSAGRGNSFARKLDGDCGWVKDPQQSANATNNTPGTVSDASYSLSIVKSMDCDSLHGSIDIYVSVSNYATTFPMNYTIARDINNDGLFDFSDAYTYGVDSTPPSITIMGLPLGRYKITVASVNGCFLKTFDVSILPCNGILSQSTLHYFRLAGKQGGNSIFEWELTHSEEISSIYLEKSTDGYRFQRVATLDSLTFTGVRDFTQIIPADNLPCFYRLHLIDREGKSIYSAVIRSALSEGQNASVWPNPATSTVHFQLYSESSYLLHYQVFSTTGTLVKQGNGMMLKGINNFEVAIADLLPGAYLIQANALFPEQPISIRFVKH